jgi:cytochrome c-type biogenesis protein CcsB
MTSSFILSIATFVYGLAGFIYIVSWIFKNDWPGKIAAWATWLGIAANVAGIGQRWMESYHLGIGHVPLSNLYESLVFFALCIAVVYLAVERRINSRAVGAVALPLAFLALAYASLSPNVDDRINPLLPALKSNWLIAHVITCFIGYAAFAIAFGISLMFLLKRNRLKAFTALSSRFPDSEKLDELTHQMVTLGFLFLTAGIITGAVWADSAWGRYWGWDPKETWSLITWFIYATLLHARLMRGWRGKRIALFAILGFGAVLFTYFGVNLLPGLHSYGA